MLTLRPARPEDVPTLAAIAVAAFAGYVERMGVEPVPMRADYAALVADGLVDVAEDGGEPVGLLVLVPHPDHLLLDVVAVAPAAHGRGIGSRLLGLAEERARAAGRSEIRLYTNEQMTENLAFYPRRGYVETHREVWHGYRRVHFAKRLP